MGRYDTRIRFWNGSSWIAPSRIQVRNADNTAWIDYGTNTSAITKTIQVRNAANNAWIRVTRDQQIVLGDKHAYQNSGGYLSLGTGSDFNLNENIFNFTCTVKKDVANDKVIAAFKNSSNTLGWSITWMADGRIRWETRYNSTSYYSYSSNYLPATGTYYTLQVNFAAGTGAGTITWNGVNSTANRTGRHQGSTASLAIGVWGTSFKDTVRCRGINYSDVNVDRTGYIDNLAVGSSNQTVGSLSTVNTTVTQDSTTNWV